QARGLHPREDAQAAEPHSGHRARRAQLPLRAGVRERRASPEVDRLARAPACVAAGRTDHDDAEGLPGRPVRRSLTGSRQLASEAVMARAVFLTSAAARATPRVCSRVNGDEMPTDATISPCGSRIGAATHLTSSRYSPSSSAYPSTRTCAHTWARRVTDLTVIRVWTFRG